VPVEQFGQVDRALALAGQYEMLIFDGAPHSTSATRAVAQASHLPVIPTGLSLDDLPAAVLLAHDLVKQGVPREKIVFALCRVGDSAVQIEGARAYLEEAGYAVLPGALPEKTAYILATDAGKALTETRYESLKRRAEEVAQGMVDRISQLSAAAGKPQKKKRSIV
jgi:chromosome partitioning protein